MRLLPRPAPLIKSPSGGSSGARRFPAYFGYFLFKITDSKGYMLNGRDNVFILFRSNFSD
jgi:hypothetical protein